MVNFLALLGWHPAAGDDREVLPREELVELFDLERVQKSGAVFNLEKLDWLNREYLKGMSDEEIAKAISDLGLEMKTADKKMLQKMIAVNRGRANTLADFIELGKFFVELPHYEPSLLIWKNGNAADVAPVLKNLQEKLL